MKKQILSIVSAGLMLGGASQIQAMDQNQQNQQNIPQEILRGRGIPMVSSIATDPDSEGEVHRITRDCFEDTIEVVYGHSKIYDRDNVTLVRGVVLEKQSYVRPNNDTFDSYGERLEEQAKALLAPYESMVQQWKQYKFQPMILASAGDEYYDAITVKECSYNILTKNHELAVNIEKRLKRDSTNNPDWIIKSEPLKFVPLPEVKDGETPEEYKMRVSDRAIMLAKKYVKKHFANGMDDIKSITLYNDDITKLWRTL